MNTYPTMCLYIRNHTHAHNLMMNDVLSRTDNNSLPFMAMLRNLRNMITQSISEAHHKKILSRLSDKVRQTLYSEACSKSLR